MTEELVTLQCGDKVADAARSRLTEIRELWELYREDCEAYHPEYGRFDEYGLSFGYVKAGTFSDQIAGYFRYQISWGGPAEEFRIYIDPEFNVEHIEFWYLDWWDGAYIVLHEDDLDLMREIVNHFSDCGHLQLQYELATT